MSRSRKLLKRVPGVAPAYRALRARRVGLRDPEEVWREATPGERQFWREELPERVASWPDYQLRMDPQAPISDPVVKRVIQEIPETTISIIDVGAGPLTALGKTYPGKQIRVVATDPMADEYLEDMERAGIEPPVRPIACRGEDLLETFEPNSFDIAFARNAIDHSADPVRVIANMVHLVKDGRYVVLRHLPREAERNYYRGEHQWNFQIDAGEFVIWRPRGPRVHMGSHLRDLATVACFHEDGWVVCLITKLRA